MTTAATPRPQHLDALDRANHVRMAQCHLKKSLARMRTPDALQLLAGMLMAPDDALDEPLGSMRLGDALAAIRRVGPGTAERLIALSDPNPPSPVKRVRELTVRQRRCVARMLERERTYDQIIERLEDELREAKGALVSPARRLEAR